MIDDSAGNAGGDVASVLAARQSYDTTKQTLAETIVAIAALRAAMDAALASGDTAKADTLRAQLSQLEHDRTDATARLDQARVAIQTAKAALLRTHSPFELLSAQHPVLLLPIRIETRFAWVDTAGKWVFEQTPGFKHALLVRIYPDEVHEDSHEPGLTAEEHALCGEFERQLKKDDALNSAPVDKQKDWVDVIRRVGAMRAGWFGEIIAGRTKNPLAKAPARRLGGLSNASIARLLPDQWVARAQLPDGSIRIAVSQPVREPLETGPSPDAVDWMVDFNSALKAGMGLIVPGLPDPLKEITRLVVVGVRGTVDPAESQTEFESLLVAQRYTRGLELPAPGTPTNTLPGARAGYTTRPNPEDVAQIEWRRFEFPNMRANPLCSPGGHTEGTRLAVALGIETAPFEFVRGAEATHQSDAWIMRDLLLASTRRSFVRQLKGIIDEAHLLEVLDWARENVSPIGPLPALRIGSQPYGILPVLALTRGRPATDSLEGRILSVLDRARNTWALAEKEVPTVANPGANPGATLIRILQRDAVAQSIAFRPALGPILAAEAVGNPSTNAKVTLDRAAAVAAVDTLGGPTSTGSPLINTLHAGFAVPLTAPLVEPTDPGANSAQRAAKYLNLVASLDLRALSRNSYPDETPCSLLFAIARLAVLELADDAARAALAAAGHDSSRWDAEEVPDYFLDQVGTPLLRLQFPSPNGSPSVADDLSETGLSLAVLKNIRSELRVLMARPPEILEALLRSTLGLFSSRLDSWYTGLATARLLRLRATTASESGIHLGAYGIVEHIRPVVLQPVPGSSGLYTSAGNGGYIHAPSVNHAAAAAVLRSVHLAHSAAGHGDAFSVDLSSERVRVGLELLDGIHQGQPLAALLGYLIERGLAAEGMQQYIAPFRAFAPLVANRLTGSGLPAEQVAATNVVDGMTLLASAGYDGEHAASYKTLWNSTPNALNQVPTDPSALPPIPTDVNGKLLDRVFAAACDALDSVSDLSVAEAVFQAVQGSPARAGAAVDALSGAPVPTPDIGIVRTPRTGIAVTHRLLVLLGEFDSNDTAWAGTPRALAEPHLEAWARAALPRPASVGIRAKFLDADGAVLATSDNLTLAGLLGRAIDKSAPDGSMGHDYSYLQLGALDFVLLADPSDAPSKSPLEQRIVALIELGRPPEALDGTLELVFGRSASWDQGTFSLVEALEIARQLRDAVSRARPLAAEDLTLPSGTPNAHVVTSDLEDRSTKAEAKLNVVIKGLGGLESSQDSSEIRVALFRADALGIAGATPMTVRDGATASDQALELRDLRSQVVAVRNELQRRSVAVGKLAATDAIGRLKAIFGAALPILSKLEPASAATSLFTQNAAPAGVTSAAIRAWMNRAARVRERVGALDAVVGYADAVGQSDNTVERPALHVGQIGGAQGERWVALAPAAGARIPAGRVSLVAMTAGEDLPSGALAGLLVDEWVEVVPSAAETTSVAFHYDAPSSAAAQVWLLGLPPEGNHGWSQSDVFAIVDEALSLARMRLVDLDEIPGLGQLLPAFVTRENPHGDTVGLDIMTLTEPKP